MYSLMYFLVDLDQIEGTKLISKGQISLISSRSNFIRMYVT